MITEVVGLLQGLAIMTWCNRRRQQSSAATKDFTSGVTYKTTHRSLTRGAGSGNATRNTKAFKDRSNESTDDTGTGFGSMRSDTEASSDGFQMYKKQSPSAPISAPPGLEMFQQPQAAHGNFNASTMGYAFDQSDTRLRADATPFVPDYAGYPEMANHRQWTHGIPESHLSQPPPPPPQGYYGLNDITSSSLQDVIGKLSPQDAAIVIASMQKHGSPGVQNVAAAMAMGLPVVYYPHPVAVPDANGYRHSQQAPHQSQPTAPCIYQAPRAPPVPVKDEMSRGYKPNAQHPPPRSPAPSVLAMDEANTLRDNLRQLSEIDPKRVLMVRKINKLGLNSAQLLEIHFSQFGPVHKVLISHSIEKPNGKRPRLRPAGLCFVAMENVADADTARQRGSEQTVLGVTIRVGEYEDHQAAKMSADGESCQ